MLCAFRLLAVLASVGLLCMTILASPVLGEGKTKQQDQELRQMIGQMVLVGFTGNKPDDPGFQRVLEQAKNGEITGVIFLQRNIVSERAVKQLNSRLEQAAHGRLLIAVDQEGGRIQRLTSDVGFKNTPGAASVAKTMDEGGAYEVYSALAGELADLGFNVNLGPVVDLNVNPANPIIGRIGRSYSADPQEVIKYATAFVQGHRVKKVLTALKHFPGHGSSVADTHKGAVDVTNTWQKSELEPYQMLIGMGDVDMVMSSHVINRKLSSGNMPSSLSRETITKILKQDMRFDGVVISDDMQMEAIAGSRSLEDAVRQAVMAGNDILVFANDKHPDPLIPQKVADILMAAAQHNPKVLERIKDANQRISRLKKKIAVVDAAVDPVQTKSIVEKKDFTILSGAALEKMPPHAPLSLSE
jgi:beta-N-acetylhexosaminidase